VIARVRGSLTLKILAGELLVVMAGSVTLLALTLTLGPILFRQHVRDALGYVPQDVARHLDIAYSDATLIALAIAVGAAVLTAVAISVLVSYRVVGPVRTLAAASRRIAAGAYGARVAAEGTDEIALLAGAFNELAQSLEAAERRRSELLANVAHELRTPLATVQGYVEGVADGVIAPSEQTWAGVKDELQRLNRLADDLQAVSRAEERQLDLHPVPVPPGELVAAAIQAAAPAFAAQGVELTSDAAVSVPPIAVDRDRFGEVLANLLENALRHTPPGGHVAISASAHGNGVEITIADDGEGIAAEHLPHVFERFYRADPSRRRSGAGSGIGLTIARAIVEAPGGTLRAESEGRGRGARFVVALRPPRDLHELRAG
jgi:signal transduction histidine kinase